MGDRTSNDDHLVFGDFLDYLRRQGFTIGVDNYLRLQQLLNRVSSDCAPSDLKTLLCPVLATNKVEQEAFYRAFDSYFDLFNLTEDKRKNRAATKESLSRASSRRGVDAKRSTALSGVMRVGWLRLPHLDNALIMIVLLLAAGLSLIYYLQTRSELAGAKAEHAALAEQIEVKRLDAERLEREAGRLRNDARLIELYARQAFGFVRAGEVVINISPTPAETVWFNPSVPTTPSVLPAAEQTFYQKHYKAIQLLLILAPLAFFLFYELYRLNRRRLIIHRQLKRKPPYSWLLQIAEPPVDIYDAEQFYITARLMRRREVGETYYLDVDATVRATLETLGYPSFRYKTDSRQPEYLALIDRSSFRDHQAYLFNHLIEALKREAVLVAHYFYEGDPRICRNETGSTFHLEDLQDKYAAYRLLIIGNGDQLVDPITGQLASWTTSLLEWQHRAVLTPESPGRWGLREISLAGQFMLLPASLEGLFALAAYFDSSAGNTFYDRRVDGREPPSDLRAEAVDADAVESLRKYLGEATFQWLCACAIYPELQWDLTLYLGSLSCMPEKLVREENILKLIRLPWFRSGSIPHELRWLLMLELDRDKEMTIRSAIIHLLENSLPPGETYAADTHQLNLFVQRWLYRRERKQRRRMLKVIKRLPPSQVLRDSTLLQFLETTQASPLILILPHRLLKLFYSNGIPAFGARTVTRLLITIIIMMSIASLFRFIPGLNSPAPMIEANPVVTSKPEFFVLVRLETGVIVWLNQDAVVIGDFSVMKPKPSSSEPDGSVEIPPIARGFSEDFLSRAAISENRERIALYKQIEREFNEAPNTLWSLVDEIDLTFTKDVTLRIANSIVTVHLGSKDFRNRFETALQILEAIQRGDRELLSRFRVADVDRLIENADRINFIDAARPDRIVLNFSTPTGGSSRTRRR